jgi:ABC-2 type transport system ATP-binding protein
MSGQAAISCRALRKVYRSGFFRIPFTGLEGLDLEVQRGEIFGFVGPNGAGKTTTLKILVDLQRATSGEASLLGRNHRDPLAKNAMGFLPERPYFYSHLSARELLGFYGRLFGLGGQTLQKRVDSLLDRVGLLPAANAPLRTFSKGMLQRAGLAQALINEPELLILDEPMSGLDPMGRALVRDVIFEERAKGHTVFFSSHILADVELICDRVGLLIAGELRGCGTVADMVGSSVHHVDCAFRLPQPVDLPGTEISTDGKILQQRMATHEVDSALDKVRSVGGSVLVIQPVRMTLEDVLTHEIRESAVEAS